MTTVKARHLLLVLLLLEHGKQTASTLGQWMNVHVRTVSRHADDLREIGIGVQPVKGAHGGFVLDASSRVRLASFIHSGTGRRVADAMDELQLRLEMRAIIDRLAPELRAGIHARLDQLVRDDVPAGVPPGQRTHITTLRRALWRNERVFARIRSAPGDAEWRAVDPLVVTCHGDIWYLVGFCTERQDMRVYDLSEIEDVTLLDQPAETPDVLDARRPSW
ncbi:MAG TPA: WYL domain-containing protein [Ktedonobacterales bacterium]|nr:WYL domain-containing protein [Ktedonobacterales bacterium]